MSIAIFALLVGAAFGGYVGASGALAYLRINRLGNKDPESLPEALGLVKSLPADENQEGETPALPEHATDVGDEPVPADGPAYRSTKHPLPRRVGSQDALRRFVYLHEKLERARLKDRHRSGEGKTKAKSADFSAERTELKFRAEKFSLELLMDSLANDGVDTPYMRATVAALSMRTDPKDIKELSDYLLGDGDAMSRSMALRCIGNRGPLNEDTITLVMTCRYEDEAPVRREARKVLRRWERKYPVEMGDYLKLE